MKASGKDRWGTVYSPATKKQLPQMLQSQARKKPLRAWIMRNRAHLMKVGFLCIGIIIGAATVVYIL